MRTGLAYTSARILMLIVSGIVLYLCGARGILLLVLAFLVSAIGSYILLSRQREKMAGALAALGVQRGDRVAQLEVGDRSREGRQPEGRPPVRRAASRLPVRR